MAIQPSIQWVNNQTRLNAQNMNTIGEAIDAIGFELYGDNNNGLVNTVEIQNGWFVGNAQLPNSGVFNQLHQIGQAVLTPNFRTDANHNYASGDYNYNEIQQHPTTLPDTVNTANWNLTHSSKAGSIVLQLHSGDGPKRSLLGPSVPDHNIGESYIDALARTITWNYERVIDIGSIYRRKGMYFKNNESEPPYIVADKLDSSPVLKMVAPAVHITSDSDDTNTKVFLKSTSEETTLGSMSDYVYIGGADATNNKLFTVDNNAHTVISTSILPVHTNATLGDGNNRWSYFYIGNIDANDLTVSGATALSSLTATQADIKDASGNYVQGVNDSSVVVYKTLTDLKSEIIGSADDTVEDNTLNGVINYAVAEDQKITAAYTAKDNIIMKALNNLADKDLLSTSVSATLELSNDGSTYVNNNINIEVGSELTAYAKATLNPGLYKYEIDAEGNVTSTDKVSTDIEVKDNGYKFDWTHSRLGTYSTTNGTGASNITVENLSGYKETDTNCVQDGDKLTCKVIISHSAGSVPYNDLGFPYESGQIKEGTKQKTQYFNSYRKSFYGTLTTKQSDIDSSTIRGLKESSSFAFSDGSTFTINIPVGAIRVVFAYPASLRDVTKVEDVNAWNTDIKGSFTKVLKDVYDASGSNEKSYKVYYIDYANPNDKANSYKVTI